MEVGDYAGDGRGSNLSSAGALYAFQSQDSRDKCRFIGSTKYQEEENSGDLLPRLEVSSSVSALVSPRSTLECGPAGGGAIEEGTEPDKANRYGQVLAKGGYGRRDKEGVVGRQMGKVSRRLR
ncbi:hypothetical protein HYALB_00011926 [Hymenoscyphus albidus]|uniref:Uncharacterized protein n=1 Tax=Hymenoscyphus albidus TaxID=595503 RepID=A0A9N9LUC7_9HELO|nr:hypothetical protein HYALB_00011926 [Hymenoscyphus albidus]